VDTKVPTEKAVRTAIPPIVTSVGNPGSDSNVPSEKAVRTALLTTVLDKTGTEVDLASSIVETTVYTGPTLAANMLGIHGQLRMTILFDLRHDTACNTTFKLKFGGTTTATIIYHEGTTDPVKPSKMEIYFYNCGSAAVNKWRLDIIYTDGTIKFYVANGTSTIDTASSQAITLTVQHSVSNSNNYYHQYHLLLEQL